MSQKNTPQPQPHFTKHRYNIKKIHNIVLNRIKKSFSASRHCNSVDLDLGGQVR